MFCPLPPGLEPQIKGLGFWGLGFRVWVFRCAISLGSGGKGFFHIGDVVRLEVKEGMELRVCCSVLQCVAVCCSVLQWR